jgi:hypothetical protein
MAKPRKFPDLAHLSVGDYRIAANRRHSIEKQKVCGRERMHKIRYNLTSEDYAKILEQQDGHCAICPKTEDLVVDHCHGTKKVRGLLCRRCNVALGMLDDDADRIEGAARYLRQTGS